MFDKYKILKFIFQIYNLPYFIIRKAKKMYLIKLRQSRLFTKNKYSNTRFNIHLLGNWCKILK